MKTNFHEVDLPGEEAPRAPFNKTEAGARAVGTYDLRRYQWSLTFSDWLVAVVTNADPRKTQYVSCRMKTWKFQIDTESPNVNAWKCAYLKDGDPALSPPDAERTSSVVYQQWCEVGEVNVTAPSTKVRDGKVAP